ncbi:hsp70-binding protein 1 [Arctopsyche grandis]|uniref:hsp70-binding protein 1 n=1 Tax=Arctopsyche grandis TaxID=121162 RepID=UPI00406D8739
MAGSSSGREMLPTEQPLRPQPRQPIDLQGLLRFAVEAVKVDEEATNRPVGPLDEDRRKFLQDAINNLSVNITKELQDAINILSDREKISSIAIGSEVPTEIEDTFDCIESHVSYIDTAIGFYKLGGFSIFPVCLSCEHPTVRSAACSLLAELCQSNTFCQTQVLECGYLQTLINMLNTEQDTQLLLNLLYGISCIIRHHDSCASTFLNDGGYSGLKNALEKTSPQLKAKAAFLTNCLYAEYNQRMSDKLVSSGVLKALIFALPKQRDNYSEQILAALHTIANDSDSIVISELIRPEYALRENLVNYLQSEELASENTDYIEEKQYCETLLKILNTAANQQNSHQQQADAHVDR